MLPWLFANSDVPSPEAYLFTIVPESLASSYLVEAPYYYSIFCGLESSAPPFYLEAAFFRPPDLKFIMFTESLLRLAVPSTSLSRTFHEFASSPEPFPSSSLRPSITDLRTLEFSMAEFYTLVFILGFNDAPVMPERLSFPAIPDSCTLVIDLWKVA
jgi:hypothetical protein